jgi:NADH dehydrogenase/NADH:ubiquinone oxidoreductase subunit G
MTKERMLSITIDNKHMDVRSNQTILEAARDNGIMIPSLCAMEHLPPYGACRLCVVEVDGLRGFPTSCTTPVENGMVIRTETTELKSLRQEILRLTLGEHPASCLFCGEADECKNYQGTIRKVGMTTGCRYCPNDNRCELQQLTERIGLTETSYPVYYRNFSVEKYDPFYDRDYNLCILCGRCVRVCNDVRLNATLAFKQRGKLTTIGPAFDRTHLEAGCEFCGACVDVCPTGALSATVSKWSGKADAEISTTCVYCPIGCQLRLQTKDNKVVDALPDYASPVDHGLICVKGRFAVPEYVHSATRFSNPREMTPMGYNDISWEEAITRAADRLKDISPDECLVMVSPDLFNEDLFVAQQFVRQALGSENIASSLMIELGEDLLPLIDLATRTEPFSVIGEAQAILAIGFDSTNAYSPIGIAVKQAVRQGAFLATLNPTESNLDMLAEVSCSLDEDSWAVLLDRIRTAAPESSSTKPATDALTVCDEEVKKIAQALKGSAGGVVIVGQQVLTSAGRHEVLQALLKMREELSCKMVIAHPYTNLCGMLAMGALAGLDPGQVVRKQPSEGVLPFAPEPIDFKKPRKVVYLIGEAPSSDLPECDYLIYQNALPSGSSSRQPDLILPASLFAESAGTIINAEGRILHVRQAVAPFEESKPDWWILSRIAEKLGKGKPKYATVSAVQQELKKQVKGVSDSRKKIEFERISYPAKGRAEARTYPVAMCCGIGHARYRGIALSDVVEGMKAIRRNNE